jgi:hypothetical protein
MRQNLISQCSEARFAFYKMRSTQLAATALQAEMVAVFSISSAKNGLS